MAVLIIGISGITQKATAFEISVQPSALNPDINDVFQIEIMALNLGNGAAPSIGAFDIDFDFDSAILQFNSLTFGNGLDLGFGSLQNDSLAGGTVSVDETSFESEADLNSFQPEDFMLFSIEFTALSAGISDLTVAVQSISDASGLTLLTPTAIQNGRVNVNSGGGQIPEPTMLYLWGLGLLMLASTRSYFQRM